ncbi:MAG: metallophosphoesterase, partial [Acidobacteriota bacterium]|nr:metallophosphoesterase [Acidobacteriota bacterium]
MAIPFVTAVAVLLGLLLLLIHELRRPAGPRRWGKTLKRIRVTLATIPLLLGSIAFWAFLIEPNRLITHQETIQIANWPPDLSGLRIAVISDLHVGGPFIDEKKLRLIVARANQLHPDLIVLLGDYMSGNSWHGHRVEPEVFAPMLRDLRAPLGVYSVLGNHDWWYSGPKVRRALEANGIKVLEDEVVEVKWRTSSFWLAGLADFWTRPQNIPGTIAKVPEGKTVIALTHNPDIFPNIPSRVPLLL